MEKEIMITTIDNPFDPFDNFTSWFLYDIENNYYTNSKLARISKITDDMSEKEKKIEVERAIDRLIEIDPFDIYRKIERNVVH